MHVVTIVLPVVKDAQTQREEEKKTFIRSDFVDALANDIKYQTLRECAVEEFSTENTMLWDAYITWMISVLSHFDMQSAVTHEIINLWTSGSIRDGHQLKSEIVRQSPVLIKFLASEFIKHSSPEPITFDVEITYGAAVGLMRIYRNFLVFGSPFELNITDAMRISVEYLIEALETKISQVDDAVEIISFMSVKKTHRTTPIPGTLIRFSTHAQDLKPPSDPKEPLIIPATILEEIKACVLYMLYTNTFPRYLKRKQK